MKDKFMNIAIEEACKNNKNDFNFGGPFGAVIVKDGKIISKCTNTVILSHDATAHAEINAIRKASKKLKTHDLSGCVLYTSCFPCPMCLSAIMWSNIKSVYYFNTKEDASLIGFRDKKIYNTINNIDRTKTIKLRKVDIAIEVKPFELFENNQTKKLY